MHFTLSRKGARPEDLEPLLIYPLIFILLSKTNRTTQIEVRNQVAIRMSILGHLLWTYRAGNQRLDGRSIR
jgi:hypothetical protein